MLRGLLLSVILLATSITQVEADLTLTNDAWDSVKYFPNELQPAALRIFYCESRWDNYAVGSAGERGIPQIHPIHWQRYGVSGERLEAPVLAGIIAYQIYLETKQVTRNGWSAWTCAN